MRTIIALFLSLWTTFSFAQFTENTNVTQLKRMSGTLMAMRQQEKAETEMRARLNNIPIRFTDENYTTWELQRFINGIPYYYITYNANAALTTRTADLYPGGTLGLALTGNNYHGLGLWDGGAVRTTHQEFSGRVEQIDTPPATDYHATHVAGTLVAQGVTPAAKGMAYQATLRAFDWNYDEAEMANEASEGMELSNHSYGPGSGWHYDGGWYWFGDPTVDPVEDWKFGFYLEETALWDDIAYNAPYYLIVKAAGNDRDDTGPAPGTTHQIFSGGAWVESTDTRGPDGNSVGDGYDTMDPKASGKNTLTVGSVNDLTTHPGTPALAGYSVYGPTDDGRIKPDIVANGVNLYSTDKDSDTDYRTLTGTSMSSPNAAGSLALLQQYWKEHNQGVPMRSATLKALVLHTAQDAGNPGPDYRFGWGLLNTRDAAQLLTTSWANPGRHVVEGVIGNSQTITIPFEITSGTPSFRGTVCWTDPAGTPTAIALDPATLMLVNDLDIRVIDPLTNTVYPWVLNPANYTAAATRGDNVRDNVEQVLIDNPTPGLYTLVISHKGTLTDGQQAFSLIMSGNSDNPGAMSLAGVNTSQVLGDLNRGAVNQAVIRVQVMTVGNLTPLIVSGFSFNTNGTTSSADIANARVFYTGTRSQFDTSAQFGTTVGLPGTSFSVNGTRELVEGTNYFWLTFDIDSQATPENVVDAECLSVTIVTPVSPTITAPDGNRRIHNANYGGGSAAEGGYFYANSTPEADGADTRPGYNWDATWQQTAYRATGTGWVGDYDDGYTTRTLPFVFRYFGSNYTSVHISANGYLKFGDVPVWTGSYQTIPSAGGDNGMICGCLMDLNPRSIANSDIYAGGNDTRYVVTWYRVPKFNASTQIITFQIVLYPSGMVTVQYNESLSQNTPVNIEMEALVGIENTSGSLGVCYRDDAVGGPMFGSDLALTFGTNPRSFHLSGTDPAAGSATVSQGTTTGQTFPTAGTTVQFTGTGNTVTTVLTASYLGCDPGGPISHLPNVSYISDAGYWMIHSSAGSAIGTYNLTLDLSGIPGIVNPSTLRLLKRTDASSPWADMGTPDPSSVMPNIRWNGLTSFSEFAVGGGTDNPLPVTLSSFSATVTEDRQVNLRWVTESESGMLGYHLLRGTDDQFAASVRITASLLMAANSPATQVYEFTDTSLETEGVFHYWLESVGMSGQVQYFGPITVVVQNEPGEDPTPEIPRVTSLGQNYPNPFNPSTTIPFTLAEPREVTIEIFNIRGQRVRVFALGTMNPGYHKVIWDGADQNGRAVPGGVLFFRMNAGEHRFITRALLLK